MTKQPGITDSKRKQYYMGRVNPAVICAREEAKLGFERVVATFFFHCSIHCNTFSYCFQVDYVPRPGWGTRATTLRLVGEKIM